MKQYLFLTFMLFIFITFTQKFLEGHDYFVGNQLTLADMAFMGSLSTLIVSYRLY